MVTLSEDSCRVCLSCVSGADNVPYKSMYQLQYHKKDGQELYKEFLGVNFLAEARGYPKMICSRCEKILAAFCDFRMQCVKNEKLLLNFIDSLNVFDGQCMVEVISEGEEEGDSGLDTLNDAKSFEQRDDLDIFTTEEIDDVVDKLIESSYQMNSDKLVDLGTSIEEIVEDCGTSKDDSSSTDNNDQSIISTTISNNTEQKTLEMDFDDETSPTSEFDLELDHPHDVEVVPVQIVQASRTSSPNSSVHAVAVTSNRLNDDEEVIVSTIANILQNCGKNFCCSICSNSYRTKYDLKRHCYRHFNIEIDKPACDFCPMRFDKHAQLRTHTEKQHSNEDHRSCNICGRKFYNLLALRIHQYGSHKPKKKWQLKKKQCTYCGEIVPRLKDHILRVHDNHTYYCDLCDCKRKYKRREDLVVHMKTTHLKQKFRKCNHCTKTFASWISKYIHEIKAHTKNFPFVCKTCDYKCCTKIRYEDHMRSHAGEKVYDCPICLFGFATVSSLKKHFISHSVRSNLLCKKCGKYFQKKKHFDEHNEKHHKDIHIPLCQCPICPGKPIFSINDVNNHFTTKHPDFVMVTSSSEQEQQQQQQPPEQL